MKNILPWNRRLMVSLIDNEKDEPSILLPEDYNPKVNEYILAKVEKISEQCNPDLLGKNIILTPNGLEEVEIDGDDFYFVLDNYVVCVMEE